MFLPCLYFDLVCGIIYERLIISYFVHCRVCGWVGWNLSGRSNCSHMVGHDIVSLEASIPCIVFVQQWDLMVLP